MSGLLLPLLAGCGALAVGAFPRTSIPAEIAPPQNQRLELIAAAAGVMVYRCDPKKDAPGKFEWAFQAPEARLRDIAGKSLGRHYAGPTWEAEDGSKVVATLQAQVAAPEKTAVPWVRLGAKSTGGPGLLANATTILRVSTAGGAPPAGGCSEPDHGRLLRVEFSADYYFYVSR
jgi:FtsP/CotA-like multicopper oxidase with cupredoxin domain